MNYSDFEEKTLSRTKIYNGKIIDVVVDQVRLPSGETAKRELVFHPGAVAVIPITKEDKMILVKQFRKPMEKVTLEIPAGKIDPGETEPIKTAERELEEETGYRAQKLKSVNSMYVSPGFADELLHIFYGEELVAVPNPLPKDEDEVIELYELSLEEAKAEIESGLICDAKTIFAVQYWELQKIKKK